MCRSSSEVIPEAGDILHEVGQLASVGGIGGRAICGIGDGGSHLHIGWSCLICSRNEARNLSAEERVCAPEEEAGVKAWLPGLKRKVLRCAGGGVSVGIQSETRLSASGVGMGLAVGGRRLVVWP